MSGGASGLGEATVRRLHAMGAFVVIMDVNRERGEALAAELGERAAFQVTDVTDPAAVQAAIDRACVAGPLRVAVNCAGIGVAARTLGKENVPHDLELFRKVITVNLLGSFNVLRLASAQMAGQEPLSCGDRGVVVNTASVAAYDGQIGQIAYAASKGGVVGMTLPAARDLSRNGIRVVTIAPGLFDTPLFASLPEPARRSLEQTVPHPSRLGVPDEYGHLVEFIVANSYLNGETIRLDGSLRMAPR